MRENEKVCLIKRTEKFDTIKNKGRTMKCTQKFLTFGCISLCYLNYTFFNFSITELFFAKYSDRVLYSRYSLLYNE